MEFLDSEEPSLSSTISKTKSLDEWRGEEEEGGGGGGGDYPENFGEDQEEPDTYLDNKRLHYYWMNKNELEGEGFDGTEYFLNGQEEEDNISHGDSSSSSRSMTRSREDDDDEEEKKKVTGQMARQCKEEKQCSCDPDDDYSDGRRRRFTLPPTPIPSDHTFENLDSLRRNLCKQIFPKNLGLPLTEDLLLDILIKNPLGDFEMLLPGNQIYPGFLKTRITDDDIPIIVNVLLEIRGISKLNLCYNEITDAGIELLAPALQECGNLIELDLMHNNLTATGILSICKALLHRAPLHSLRLTGMKIGEEGMNAFTCLVLSGRAPLDIDIGECDLNCAGWQSLCTALHAMDHDIDYPNYLLLKNDLPMDLVKLKEGKTEYNEEVKHATELNRKGSQPTFVRVKSEFPGDSQNPSGCETVGLPELFETFSATILQGLFDLRHRFSEDDLKKRKPKEIYSDPYYQKTESEANKILPDVSKIIENFHKSRDGEWLLEDEDDLMISPSLYRLDVIDEEIMEPIAEARDDDDDELHDENLHPPDIYTAEAASTFFVREEIYKVVKDSAKSEYMDRSDITQLLLLTVLETIDTIGKGQNLTEDDCHRILEDALEKVHRLIFPRMPADSKISREDVSCFFKVIFSVAQGTFLQLFENPFVTQALVDNVFGTTGARGERQMAKENEERRPLTGQQGAMSEEQVGQIAISFLHGVLIEAAQIIGVASPFGVDDDEDVGNDLVSTELKIEDQMDTLMETAAAIAVASKAKADSVEETTTKFSTAADQFVVELFENVNNMVVESDLKDRELDNEEPVGPTTYKFVSRPSRLVLNRPIFTRQQEVIMAAKLGDYMGANTTVRALHAQKWNLGEDGMAAFMENFIQNMTLVVLDLSHNRLAADGIKLLSVYVTKNNNLKHLILHHNGIKDAGMTHLNLYLCDCSLKSLDISYNGITYRELDPLLTQLPSTQIQTLYLWGNKFGPNTWNILRTLYEGKLLSPNQTDVILQRVDHTKMVVKNMQVRDINEYYEVPAILDEGLRLPPVYTDNSHSVRHKTVKVAV